MRNALSNDAHGQIPGLTGLRGVAALLVVLSHLVGLSLFTQQPLFLGELGVMVFFSLSGFLMALIYLGKAFDRPAATRYAIARFARIAPAYLFVIVGAYIVRNAIDPDFTYQITKANVLRHLLFSGNAAVFWSIPPEVQFYGLFIAIWMGVDRLARRGRSVPLVLVIATCMTLILERSVFPGTFVGSKLHFFLFGAIAGCFRSYVVRLPVSPRVIACAQGGALLLMIALGADAINLGFRSNVDVYLSLGNAVAAATVVLLISYDAWPARWLLTNRTMMLCGTCSFSIYLLHDPVIYWLRPCLEPLGAPAFTAVVVLATVALSYATYRLIELPGSRLCRLAFATMTSALSVGPKSAR